MIHLRAGTSVVIHTVGMSVMACACVTACRHHIWYKQLFSYTDVKPPPTASHGCVRLMSYCFVRENGFANYNNNSLVYLLSPILSRCCHCYWNKSSSHNMFVLLSFVCFRLELRSSYFRTCVRACVCVCLSVLESFVLLEIF